MGIDLAEANPDSDVSFWAIQQENGSPVLRHRERLDLGNFSLRIEQSQDLLSWAPLGIEPERVDNGDGTKTLSYRFPMGSRTAYLRLAAVRRM
jgi:hypothetical protein